MVDDTFGFKNDYVSYTMTPEIVSDFIKNHLLWQNKDITQILSERELSLEQLNNKTRRLDFLQKNRLIYAFQKNIVRNASSHNSKYHKYIDWFEIAEKTRNRLNEKADFLKYADDSVFAELIRRISNETLTDEDYTYIDNYQQYAERVRRYDSTIFQEGMEVGIEKGMEKGMEKGLEIGVEQGIYETAKNGIIAGLSNDIIQTMTKLSIEQINMIRTDLASINK
jgi:hypothetical protein